MNRSPEHAREAYEALYVYALERADPAFILQHVVDAYGAQSATVETAPMGLVFALAGLYLHCEKHWDGRAIQRAHSEMARQKRAWPHLPLPESRGELTAAEVLAATAGPERDRAIDAWCRSIWEAYAGNRLIIIDLLREYGIA